MIDAERNMLSAERIGVQLAGSRMNSTVGLIKALGGGWGDLPPAAPATPANTAAAANAANAAQPATVAQQERKHCSLSLESEICAASAAFFCCGLPATYAHATFAQCCATCQD